MRNDYTHVENLRITILTHDDCEAYRDYNQLLKSPAHFRGLMQGKDLNNPQTYLELFKAIAPDILMGLWSGDKLIGQTGVLFDRKATPPTAMFQGSEILDDYRGLELSKQLYDARERHLKEIGYKGKVITSIRPDNLPSVKAAQRNGFVATNEIFSDKVIYERLEIPTLT